MFFQQRKKDVLPISDPSVTQNSEPSNSNWQKWAKWSFASVGGAVLTTAVFYYGGPVLWAGLSSLIASASRFSKDSQSTTLSQMDQQTATVMNSPYDVSSTKIEYPPHIRELLDRERNQQTFFEGLEAYTRKNKAKVFFKELRGNDQPLAEVNVNSEDEGITEHLLNPIVKKQIAEGLKLAEFEELPLHDFQKRQINSTIPIDGLVAYYPFNGNANDESGNSNHGIVYGASLTIDRFGDPDGAYSFDGNDYISCPTVSPFERITWAVWFKTSHDYANEAGEIVAPKGAGFIHIASDNTVKGELEIGSGNFRTISSGQTYNDDIWHLATLTYDKQKFMFYLDGIEIGSQSDTDNINYDLGGKGFWIGVTCTDPNSGRCGNDRFFYGMIDDVYIYNRALSEAEIRTLYHIMSWPLRVYNVPHSFNYTEDIPVRLDTLEIVTPEVNASFVLSLSNQNVGQLETAAPISISVFPTFTQGVWSVSGNVTEVNVLLRGLTFIPTQDYNGNFTITANIGDGVNTSLNRTIEVTGIPVNDPPFLINNQLTVRKGQSLKVTENVLSASDVDNKDDGLLFAITNFAYGHFEYASVSGMTILSFSQQEIFNNNINFVHTGGDNPPRYEVSVTDGELNTLPSAAVITFLSDHQGSSNSSAMDITFSNSSSVVSILFTGQSQELNNSDFAGKNVGAIIGGLIGGCIILCIVSGGVSYLLYRKNRSDDKHEIEIADITPKVEERKSGKISMMKKGGILSISVAIPYSKLKFKEKIGGGGSSLVYKGRWQHTDVAIKQLTLVNIDEQAMKEFVRETSLMSNLRHPNIVQFFGVCLKPECCIVMEYMSGGSLFNLLHSDESLNWPTRWQMALDITQGLGYLHDNNVIHRDLKSLNVLLDKDRRAKLTDFGLSKVKTDTIGMSTKTMGTPAWMPPEVIMDDDMAAKEGIARDYTKKSDVYSYGMILWELTSRKAPFEDVPNNFQVIQKIAKGNRPEISADCPFCFSGLIQRCWVQRAEERPDIDETIQILEAHQEEFK